MCLLENRYGQPHIVTKACVDAMVDGPTIANNDRVGLREFADRARTLYETVFNQCFGRDEHDQHSPDELKTSDNSSSEMERERSTNSRTKTESQPT